MDFRSRKEIKEGKVKAANAAQTETQLTHANDRQLKEIDSRMEALARFAGTAKEEIGREVRDEITGLKQELTSLHAMIQSSGEQDMDIVQQMNANHEQRMAALMAMIKEL